MATMATGNFVIGVDLGQIYDHSALAVVERLHQIPDAEHSFEGWRRDDFHHVVHLQRWDLGTPYRQVVADVGSLIRRAGLREALIVLDATGIGKAVVNLFHEAHSRDQLGEFWPRGYVITGGREITGELVPKRELVAKLQTLLQAGRLKVAAGLQLADVLKREMLQFRAKTLATGGDTYEAARERDHDDVVLAVALACWARHTFTEPRRFVINDTGLEATNQAVVVSAPTPPETPPPKRAHAAPSRRAGRP